MLEEFRELYIDSGFWAHPILISTIILFVAGSVMLFTVRLIKKFILYSIIALVLPNAIGVVGYLEEAGSLEEAIMEKGAAMTEEMIESAEEISVKPIYLSLIGSFATVVVGIVGIMKIRLTRRAPIAPEKPPDR